jgi:hypothetical protein
MTPVRRLIIINREGRPCVATEQRGQPAGTPWLKVEPYETLTEALAAKDAADKAER